jgi:hypothetical protein
VIAVSARESSYSAAASVADAVSFAASWMAEGQVDVGVALRDLTAASATGNGSSVDNAASSANGAVGVLHVTANSSDGATTVKIQHSTDNSTWADLLTFAVVGAGTKTAERVAVTGTVNRYVRATWTLAGSASVTLAVALCRR